MANHVLLNNVDHKDLKVITTRSAKFGDDVMWALTFAAEFRSIQAHYPIFFRKDSQSGKFRAVAMFGFEDRENLFLADDGWDVPYLPLTIERQPFLIGFQQAPESDSGERAAVIHVDMDSPRVSRSEGEAFAELFALGHFGPGIQRVSTAVDNLPDRLERFEKVMAGGVQESEIGHLHLLPASRKVAKARVKRGDRGEVIARGADKLTGYRSTTRHKTVGGGF